MLGSGAVVTVFDDAAGALRVDGLRAGLRGAGLLGAAAVEGVAVRERASFDAAGFSVCGGDAASVTGFAPAAGLAAVPDVLPGVAAFAL